MSIIEWFKDPVLPEAVCERFKHNKSCVICWVCVAVPASVFAIFYFGIDYLLTF